MSMHFIRQTSLNSLPNSFQINYKPSEKAIAEVLLFPAPQWPLIQGHPPRRNVTMVGLKKPGHILKNLTKDSEPQRYSWERKRRRRNQGQGHLEQKCRVH